MILCFLAIIQSYPCNISFWVHLCPTPRTLDKNGVTVLSGFLFCYFVIFNVYIKSRKVYQISVQIEAHIIGCLCDEQHSGISFIILSFVVWKWNELQKGTASLLIWRKYFFGEWKLLYSLGMCWVCVVIESFNVLIYCVISNSILIDWIGWHSHCKSLNISCTIRFA